MAFLQHRGLKRTLLGALLLMASFFGIAVTRYQLYARPKQAFTIQEVFMVPPGKVIRQMDLGYHTLAADLLFIRANLYYGEHMLSDEQLPWIGHFIDILMEVDPNFRTLYFWGALVTTYYKRQLTEIPQEILMRANQILQKGMDRFPDDYRFPMRIGYNFHYELGDAKQALPFFSRAAILPGAPSWIKEKLVDIYTRKDQKEMAKQILSELVMEETDPSLQKDIRDRMEYILNKEEQLNWEENRKHLLDEWHSGYPYLPLDLYLLIREP